MNQDLNDEAMREMAGNPCNCCQGCFENGWRECRRRAEALLEEERRKAFAAAWVRAHDFHAGLLVSHGVSDWSPGFEEAYRAYQAELGRRQE